MMLCGKMCDTRRMRMFDLLFKNAKVVDGTGTPWYVADVAVHAGKIAKIGKISESAAKK